MTYLTHGMILRIACVVMILCSNVGTYAQQPTILHIKPMPVATDSGTVFLRTFEQEASLVVLVDSLLSSSETCNRRLQAEKRSWFDDVKWFIAGACVGMLAWEAAR